MSSPLLNYSSLLEEARKHGQEVSPRGIATLQIEPIGFHLPMGTMQGRKDFSLPLALAEGLNLVRGYTDTEIIRAVAQKTAERFYDVNDMSFYGERVNIDRILRLLRKDPHTRKATCILTTNEDPERSARCITAIQFQQLYPGTLDMHVYLRSWDLYMGLPYDIGMTQLLGCYLARVLNVDRGNAYYSCSLPHLYKSHDKRAAACQPYKMVIPPLLVRGTFPAMVSWKDAIVDLESKYKGGNLACSF